jgi:hypothetical protein
LNQQAGIGFAGGGTNSAVLLGNRLLGNALVAVGVNAGWTVTLRDNELARTSGAPPLMMVAAGATASLTNNTLRGGGVASVRVAGEVWLHGNRHTSLAVQPTSQAVWALPGARVTLSTNEITGWRHALMAERAEVRATGNVVLGAVDAAFRLRGEGPATEVRGNAVPVGVKELAVEPAGKR